MASRRAFLTCCAGIAAVTGGAMFSIFNNDDNNNSKNDNVTNTGLTISSSGVSCLDDFDSQYSGWFHVTPSQVSFDVLIQHDRDEDIGESLDHLSNGEYGIHLNTTSPETGSDSNAVESCSTGSRIKGVGVLPERYQDVYFYVNDELIVNIEREGDFPELRPIRTPITNRKR